MRIGQLLCEIAYGSPNVRTALEAILELIDDDILSCPLCRGTGVVEEYTDVYGGTRNTTCHLCGGDKVVSIRDIISSYLKKEDEKYEVEEIEF